MTDIGNTCAECGSRFRVMNSRPGDGEPIIVYRQRRCVPCGTSLWTVEIPFNGPIPKEVMSVSRKKAPR